MKTRIIYTLIFMVVIFTARPVHAFAKTENSFVSDSVPPKKNPDEHPDKNHDEIIKEVPKSRKQPKPISLPLGAAIKPIKIIRPKILKPLIH